MAHKDIEALLPFYVNGTLDEHEHAEVRQAIEQSAALRQDVEALALIREEMQATTPTNEAAELGLARLMRSIEQESQPTPANDTARAPLRISPIVGGAVAAMVALAFYAGTGFAPEKPEYIQASGDEMAATLTVRFQSDVQQHAVAAALLELGLVIVDGPSARGFYRLKPLDESELDTLAEMVRAQSSVFEFVETPQ